MESSRAVRGHRARPTRRPLLSTALASVVIAGVTAGGAAYVTARAHSGTRVVSSAAAPTASSAAGTADADVSNGEASVEPVADPAVDRDALLADAVEAVSVPDGAQVSVAVLDLGSGESSGYGDGTFDTASIVKVDILAALLLRAQDAGTSLTARERAYATAMIEHSDNASASALWLDTAGRPGSTRRTSGSGSPTPAAARTGRGG